MGKSRSRAKRARGRKRAANQAAKAERREAEEAEERGRDLRRQVAHSEAIADSLLRNAENAVHAKSRKDGCLQEPIEVEGPAKDAAEEQDDGDV